MFKRIRWLVALPVVLLLGGCGLPPALVVASYALDGFSFMVSGKSVSDHAISRVMSKDCAMLRVVAGREACVELNDGAFPDIVVAAVPQNDNWNGDAALAVADGAPLQLAATTPILDNSETRRFPSIVDLLPWELRPQPVPRFALLSLDGPDASPLADFIGLEQFSASKENSNSPAATAGANPATLARAGDEPLWRPAAWETDVPPAPGPVVKMPLAHKSLAPFGRELPSAQIAALSVDKAKFLSLKSTQPSPAVDELGRLSLNGEVRLSPEPDRVPVLELGVTSVRLALRRGPAGSMPIVAALPVGDPIDELFGI